MALEDLVGHILGLATPGSVVPSGGSRGFVSGLTGAAGQALAGPAAPSIPAYGISPAPQQEQDAAALKEAATIPLLARIAHGEVDDQIMKKRGFASEYDVPYNYTKTDKPLSQMTIN